MTAAARGWRDGIPAAVRPYCEGAPLAALFLGIASGFPYTLLAATLTNRLADHGLEKSSISLFALTLLPYNFKWLWAPWIDRLPIPGLTAALGQRRSWLILSAVAVVGAIAAMALADPGADVRGLAIAAIALGLAGASFDVVIDAYRIELLLPEQLGVGSGMSQYGWRIGAAGAATIALGVAGLSSWTLGYLACAPLVLCGVITGFVMGEPLRRPQPPSVGRGLSATLAAITAPLADFFGRPGALLVLAFVLVHKIGDTMANLMIRDLLVGLGFTKPEIMWADVWVGFLALLAGIFVGGVLYTKLGLVRSVFSSLILMAISNLSFALLAAAGHDVPLLAFAIGFENFASGIGGVVVVAYLSALCNLAFTATQFALLSAAASILGRFISGTTAGTIIEAIGYFEFYLVTTAAAVPGILLYVWMWRSGLVDDSTTTARSAGRLPGP